MRSGSRIDSGDMSLAWASIASRSDTVPPRGPRDSREKSADGAESNRNAGVPAPMGPRRRLRNVTHFCRVSAIRQRLREMSSAASVHRSRPTSCGQSRPGTFPPWLRPARASGAVRLGCPAGPPCPMRSSVQSVRGTLPHEPAERLPQRLQSRSAMAVHAALAAAADAAFGPLSRRTPLAAKLPPRSRLESRSLCFSELGFLMGLLFTPTPSDGNPPSPPGTPRPRPEPPLRSRRRRSCRRPASPAIAAGPTQ